MSEFVDRFSVTDESGNIKKEININFGDPLAREQSQRAVTTSEQAKQTANEAKQIAQEAKDAVPGEVSQQVAEATQELSGEIEQAKQTANEAKETADDTYINRGIIQWTDNPLLNRYLISCGYYNVTGSIASNSSNIVNVTYSIYSLKIVSDIYKPVFKCESLGIMQYLQRGFNEIRINSRERIYIVIGDKITQAGTYNYSFAFNAEILLPYNPELYLGEKIVEQAEQINILQNELFMTDIALKEILIDNIFYDRLIHLYGFDAEDNAVRSYDAITDNSSSVRSLKRVALLDCRQLSTFKNIFVEWNGYNMNLVEVSGLFGYEHMVGNALQQMFYECRKIKRINFVPNRTPLNVTNINSMFGAQVSELEEVNFEDVTFGSVDTAEFLFTGSRVRNVVIPELPGVTSISGMFHVCYYVETINMDAVDCSNVVKTVYFAQSCGSLVEFSGLKNIKKSYKLDFSLLLTHESALSCIAGLYDLTEGGTVTDYTAQTLTFHPDVKAQLTEEEIAEATAKGWNIA